MNASSILRSYEHMEGIGVDNWVKRCISVTVKGRVPRGKPKKTWGEVLHNDLRFKGLNRKSAINRAAWRTAINLESFSWFPYISLEKHYQHN